LDFVKGSIEKAHLLGYCSPTRKTCSTLAPYLMLDLSAD
jgi:hypothetical protein